MLISIEKIKNVSKSLLGTKYTHLGRSILEGLDCYGLVLEFYKLLGVPLRPYLESYDIDWYRKQDLFDSNAVDFERIELPRPGCTMAMAVHGSKVPNHLMVYLGENSVLNTDMYAGVHITRWFVIRDKITGYYARSGLQLTDSV